MSKRESLFPAHRRPIIEEAKLGYEAHWEQMLLAYPHLRMTPWDDQDAAVRKAWVEAVTPDGAATLASGDPTTPPADDSALNRVAPVQAPSRERGHTTTPGASLWDARHVELVLRNVALARDRAMDAIRSGEAPDDVLNRTLDFVRGFIDGTSALIVPPDMIDPAELETAVALGQELAERYGW